MSRACRLPVFLCLCVLLLATLAGCAAIAPNPGKEPAAVIIRNRSGADLAVVTLSARQGERGVRFGSVSPVPAGVDQSVGRPSERARFPRDIVLEWRDGQGGRHRSELTVEALLRGAPDTGSAALVFEIGPGDAVRVYLEAR